MRKLKAKLRSLYRRLRILKNQLLRRHLAKQSAHLSDNDIIQLILDANIAQTKYVKAELVNELESRIEERRTR